MTEKILQTKKNGMAVLLLVLLGYVVAIAAAAAAGMAGVPGLEGVPGMVGNIVLGVAVVYMALAWILLCGLKVLKPQEALVLTLFGNYIGTLKGEGFYWVNPFCTAVNPAAGTRLSQSGDVQSGDAPGCKQEHRRQENFPQADDPQQRPPEDQRLPGQSRGDRHCGHLAGQRHRQGRVQCGQLQGIPLPAV